MAANGEDVDAIVVVTVDEAILLAEPARPEAGEVVPEPPWPPEADRRIAALRTRSAAPGW
jgi:hypothetical protein